MFSTTTDLTANLPTNNVIILSNGCASIFGICLLLFQTCLYGVLVSVKYGCSDIKQSNESPSMISHGSAKSTNHIVDPILYFAIEFT